MAVEPFARVKALRGPTGGAAVALGGANGAAAAAGVITTDTTTGTATTGRAPGAPGATLAAASPAPPTIACTEAGGFASTPTPTVGARARIAKGATSRSTAGPVITSPGQGASTRPALTARAATRPGEGADRATASARPTRLSPGAATSRGASAAGPVKAPSAKGRAPGGPGRLGPTARAAGAFEGSGAKPSAIRLR